MLTDEKYYQTEDDAYDISVSGRPGYDVMFNRNRVEIGSAIDSTEFARRLAYELQIPSRYGTRILKAVNRVIDDALSNGEGIQFNSLGILKLKQYSNIEHKLPDGTVINRESMFKIKLNLYAAAKEKLVKLTNKIYKEKGK